MSLESVKVDSKYVDILRKVKKETRVPISASIENAIKIVYGEPQKTTTKYENSIANRKRNANARRK